MLFIKLLKAKYGSVKEWLRGKHIKNASWIWKGLESCREVVKKGVCHMVGHGVSIDVWNDPWIPWLDRFKPKLKSNEVEMRSMVIAELKDESQKTGFRKAKTTI